MSVSTQPQTLVPITNPHFQKGYELGRIWYFSSFTERIGEPDDLYLIENISGYCEKGLHTDPEWLAERIGFIMGMVSCNVISEE